MAEDDARTYTGRTLVPGRASGDAVVLDEPLSLWGGFDEQTGRIIDGRHPQFGQRLTDRVVLLPSGRGSSSSSSILAEAVRLDTAPLAIVFRHPDSVIALGAVVARELYERGPVVVTLPEAAYDSIRTGDRMEVDANATAATVRLAAPMT